MIFKTISLATASFLGVALGMWTIDREPPNITVQTEVLTRVVKPGEALRIRYKIQRRRICATHVDRLLLDASKVRTVLPDFDFVTTPSQLGDDEYISVIDIPDDASPGEATYRSIASYQCNLVHKWFWPISREPTDVHFTIDAGLRIPVQ